MYNDVAQTGGEGTVLQLSRRQSAALSAVMMCIVVSSLSACCYHYFVSANFAHHSQNLLFIYEGCHIELHLPVSCTLLSLISLTPLLSDRADDDRAGDCCEPACGRVGGDPGVGDHPTAPVWPRLDWHEEPGQQLLPQLCHASALHRSRLPEQVSILFYYSPHPPVHPSCYADHVTSCHKRQ